MLVGGGGKVFIPKISESVSVKQGKSQNSLEFEGGRPVLRVGLGFSLAAEMGLVKRRGGKKRGNHREASRSSQKTAVSPSQLDETGKLKKLVNQKKEKAQRSIEEGS